MPISQIYTSANYLARLVLQVDPGTVGQKSLVSEGLVEDILLIVVGAVISAISGYLLWRVQQRRAPSRRVTYDSAVEDGLVSVDGELAEDLTIHYGGNEVKSLARVRSSIAHVGNRTIQDQHIRYEFSADVQILSLEFDREPEVEYGASLAKVDGKDNEAMLTVDYMPSKIQLDFTALVSGGVNGEIPVLHGKNTSNDDVELVSKQIAVQEKSNRPFYNFFFALLAWITVPSTIESLLVNDYFFAFAIRLVIAGFLFGSAAIIVSQQSYKKFVRLVPQERQNIINLSASESEHIYVEQAPVSRSRFERARTLRGRSD